MEMRHDNNMQMQKEHGSMYTKLLMMAVLSFISMYILMYAMVNEFANAYPNVNQFYMAGLMTSPMIIIEVLLMRMMYRNKKLNAIAIGVSLIALVVFFMLIRQQAGVGDRQFVRGMIPHHAAAILMAKKSNLSDPKVKKLAEEIISSQEKEIAQMKAKLKEIKNK